MTTERGQDQSDAEQRLSPSAAAPSDRTDSTSDPTAPAVVGRCVFVNGDPRQAPAPPESGIVAEIDSELAACKDDEWELRRKLERARNEILRLSKWGVDQSAACGSAEQRIASLEAEVAELRTQREAMAQIDGEQDTRIASLEAEVARLTDELSEAGVSKQNWVTTRRINKEQAQRIASLEAEVARLNNTSEGWMRAEEARKDRAAAVSQWKKANARVAELEAEVARLTNDFEAANHAVNVREGKMLEQAARIASLEAEVARLTRSPQSLANENVGLWKRIDELEAEVARLKDEGERDYKDMRRMQANFIDADHARIALESELARAKPVIEAARRWQSVIGDTTQGTWLSEVCELADAIRAYDKGEG